MKQTRICRLLGIDHPLFQGGMLWLATAELAAAVCNTGGLGIVSPYAAMARDGDPVENLTAQIARTRALTNKRFGVNIPLDLRDSGLLIDCLIKEKVDLAVTAAGSPALYTEVLRSSGVTVLHIVSSAKQALFAEKSGVDGVIAAGCEAAGRIGFDETPLFSLIPQVSQAVRIPVIAAGGIVDGKGMAAAFALGAEAVQLGTRFVATVECIAHPRYKQAIIAAEDHDTVVTCRSLIPRRSLKTTFTQRLVELDRASATAQEISSVLGYRTTRIAQIEGDLNQGEAFAGSSVGLIKEILPVSQVVGSILDGYEKTINEIR
ncbi:MAG TPA: nitronate monooxygenase [Syntrophorhabdaceae bacterium]|nr:nitronate monooxygenase [Syntrophorhabdaceae bacterium]